MNKILIDFFPMANFSKNILRRSFFVFVTFSFRDYLVNKEEHGGKIGKSLTNATNDLDIATF